MSNETKIAPCFMPDCEDECELRCACRTLDTDDHWIECLSCAYRTGDFDAGSTAIAAHNKLCADIEKGRKYDDDLIEAHIKWGKRLIEIAAKRDEYMKQLERLQKLLARPDIKAIIDKRANKEVENANPTNNNS